MTKLVTLKIPRYILIYFGILVGSALIGGGVALLVYEDGNAKISEIITKAAQVLTPIVLVFSAVTIWRQLRRQKAEQERDQLIAWKNSLHSLNQLAMQSPETFREVLYPNLKDGNEAKKVTAAYASLHALEVIYYMRKEEEYPPDRLREFLEEYVSGVEMRKAWEVSAAHAAFTKEFQEQMHEVINKKTLEALAKEEKGRKKKEKGNGDKSYGGP